MKANESETILRVEHLEMTFLSGGNSIRALNDISFAVRQGETVGIVGESGCGKTTLGRCIVRAHKATAGHVYYRAADGQEYDLQHIDRHSLKKIRKEVQMIFQDPYSSLDPRMTVYDIISEPLKANFKGMPKAEMERRVKEIAEKVGLNPSFLKRYPHAFSGGQRQRIGIARALVLYPRLIVCDEAVSALDVSVQAQVINLLKDLQKELNLTYLFISHDLSVVEHISDQVGVMYLGRMMEYAGTQELFQLPGHPYTEALLSAVPIADPKVVMNRIMLEGEIPNPANAPSGCFFHTRCRYSESICSEQVPAARELAPTHYASCLRCGELSLMGMAGLQKPEVIHKNKELTADNKKFIIFIDCGDTLVDESTQVVEENGDVLRAEMLTGAREALLTLYENGYRIALVADGRTASFRNIFRELALEHVFETWVISEEIGAEKPDERMFRTAMERMKLTDRDRGRIIMIGNNLKRDIVGANRMGFHSVLISFSPRYCMEPDTAEERPDHTLTLPADLPELISRLERQI